MEGKYRDNSKSTIYKVYIRGTTDSPSYFTISHRPQKAARLISTISQPIVTKHLLVRICHVSITMYNILFQDQDDLIKLIDELKVVTDWQTLGLRLKIKPSILEEVEMNNRDATGMKRAMLKRWLRSTPQAAWDDVVSALRMMDEERAAKAIEDKYCGTSS